MKRGIFSLSAGILGVVTLLAAPLLSAAQVQMKEETLPFAPPPKEWKAFTPSVRFSADQKRMAIVCRFEKKFAVLVDGKLSASYDAISKDSRFPSSRTARSSRGSRAS